MKFERADLAHDTVSVSLTLEDVIDMFCIETCPSCGDEMVVWSHGVTSCNRCGASIAPCSVCMDERGDCDYNTCPYGCEGSDKDCEKQVTMPDICESDAEWLYRYL